MSEGDEGEMKNQSPSNEDIQEQQEAQDNPVEEEKQEKLENAEENKKQIEEDISNIDKMIENMGDKFEESPEEEDNREEGKIHITEEDAGPEIPPEESEAPPAKENPPPEPEKESETEQKQDEGIKEVVIASLNGLNFDNPDGEEKETTETSENTENQDKLNPMSDPTLMTAVSDLMVPPEDDTTQRDQNNPVEEENNEEKADETPETELNPEEATPELNKPTEEEEKKEEKDNENDNTDDDRRDTDMDDEGFSDDDHNEENNEDKEENENADNNNENEDNNEKEDDGPVIGMKVVDNYSSPEDMIPNVAKTIDLSELPLLETPAEIETQCKKQVAYFQQKKSLPQNTDIQTLLKYLQRQKVNSVQQSKYLDAHNYEDLIKQITAYNQTQRKTEQYSQISGQLEDRIHELENELKRAEKDRDKEIKKATMEHEKHLQRLKQIQNQELNKFEEKWNDVTFLRQFEKPSPKLLQMTTVERSLVVSGDYERADYIHNQVEALQVEESEEAQKRAVNVMNNEQKKILAKHKREEETIVEQFNVILDKINKTSDLEASIITDRLNRVKKDYEELKNAKTSKLPPLKNNATKDQIVTPRTQSRMVICKQTMKNPKITVKPLGSIIKKKSRQSSALNTSKL